MWWRNLSETLFFSKFRAIETYWKKAPDQFLWPHIFNLIFFKKLKRGLGLVLLPNFWHNFWRKIFLLLYSINCPSFIVWNFLRENEYKSISHEWKEIIIGLCTAQMSYKIATVYLAGCLAIHWSTHSFFLRINSLVSSQFFA